MFLFQLTQVVLIELFPNFDGGSAVTIYAPEDSETKKLNEKLREKKARKTQRKVKGEEEVEDEGSVLVSVVIVLRC